MQEQLVVAVAELVWDTAIYPRQDVSEQHVANLVEALRCGNILPPILIDRKTRRIVDGVHRWRARRKVEGDTAEIDCVAEEFADDGEMFLRAIATNTAHGLSLTSFEKTKCILLAEKLGIEKERITECLRITFEKWERMRSEVAFRSTGGVQEEVPLKPPMRSFRGRSLNRHQVSANDYSGGMQPLYYVNQLILLLKAGICQSAGSPQFLSGLNTLRKLLNEEPSLKHYARKAS